MKSAALQGEFRDKKSPPKTVIPRIVIPEGTRLFHATGEPFAATAASDLRPGIDEMLWTAKDSAIAQTYIPESGGLCFLKGHSLLNPSVNTNGIETWLQLQAGLEFSNVQWRGSSPDSYHIARHPCPPAYPKDPEAYWEEQERAKRTLHGIFSEILTNLGYSPENPWETPDYLLWRIKTHYQETADWKGWIAKPAKWKLPGRLFILRTTRSIKLKEISQGNEGCLLDPDHLKYWEFVKAKTAGYDGVVINDFAQTENSNFGHQSIGVFSPDALELENIIPAEHPDEFYTNHSSKGNYQSREMELWANQSTK